MTLVTGVRTKNELMRKLMSNPRAMPAEKMTVVRE